LETFDERVAGWRQAAGQLDYRAVIHPSGAQGDAAYMESGREAYVQLQAAVIRHWQAGPVADRPTVLEFGCGDGRILRNWPTSWHRIGCDASPEMIDLLHAADRAIDVFTWDGLDWRGISVDVAYAVTVLIHHHTHDGIVMAANLGRCVRPGGLLLLGHPLYEVATGGRSWNDVTTWTTSQLMSVADLAGLEIVEHYVSPGCFAWGSDLGDQHGAIQVLRRPL
jgi:SAM-dependent methyltransferase